MDSEQRDIPIIEDDMLKAVSKIIRGLYDEVTFKIIRFNPETGDIVPSKEINIYGNGKVTGINEENYAIVNKFPSLMDLIIGEIRKRAENK